MKKALFFSFLILLFASCNQDEKSAPEPVPMDQNADSIIPVSPGKPVKDSLVNNATVPISSNEMQDDSIFADGSKPTAWDIAGITDVNGLKNFIKSLQYMVAAGRKMEVAGHVRFPLNRSTKNVKEFFVHYVNLFTPDVKEALAKTNARQLFRNAQGVMIGDGKIWIRQQGKEFKIIAINN